MMRLILSSVVSSSSSAPAVRERHATSRPRCVPPWLECASSMMMAKLPAAVLAADLVEDERELLHRGDDDLLAALDELAQVARVLGVADRRAHLGELLDRVADLLVEDAPVGDDDDRVEDRRVVLAAGRSAGGRARRWSSTCRCRPSAGSGSACPRRARPASARSLRTTSSWW